MKKVNLHFILLTLLCLSIGTMPGIAQEANQSSSLFPAHLSSDEITDIVNGTLSLDDFEAAKVTRQTPSVESVELRSLCEGIGGEITTTFTNGNGASGNMFNITNVAGYAIQISSLDGNFEPFGPQFKTVKVWYREGGYEGFETNVGAWTLLGEDNMVESLGQNTPTPINVGGLILEPGITYGLFIHDTSSSIDYTNGSNTYNNGEIEIQTGIGRGVNTNNPFNGAIFNPRTWNGTVHYCRLELPEPWVETTVGNDDECNIAYYNPGNDFYTVQGCGNNAFPGTTSDNVHYAHQTLCGNGSITVKMESVTPNGYGGIMIRETTDAGSKQVAMFSDLGNVIRWESRMSTGAAKSVQSFYKPFPYWLRLERQGDWIFGYYSSNGFSFQPVQAVFVPMASCIQYGMAAFTYQTNSVTSAQFSNVSLVGGEGLLGGTPFQVENKEAFAQDRVFPNPASSEITLEIAPDFLNTTRLTLRNSLGQIIETRQLLPGNSRINWELTSLDNGLYLIEIERSGQAPKVLRVVKNN
jgi:regulation of enolase protein 1 (concanavalin A-like superfamily)